MLTWNACRGSLLTNMPGSTEIMPLYYIRGMFSHLQHGSIVYLVAFACAWNFERSTYTLRTHLVALLHVVH